jgi:anti-anti-sigma factor
MTLVVRENAKDLIVLELEGSLDLQGTREIETAMFDNIGAGDKGVVMDFEKVSFVASFGLRMIIDVVKSLDPEKKKLVILNPKPPVEKLLHTAGMDNVLLISHNEEEARQAAR